MPLLTGLLYTTNVSDILKLKHTNSYVAQHKTPHNRSLFGYSVIKLDQDVTYYVGWKEDSMTEYNARKGEYLIQTPGQPPEVIKSWNELRTKYKVFQKKKA
ncbi:hypothetical protein [Virgibacillus dokdonensis]|uniref:Uncharacterized protein n=1 Tax=Virgibacillus dokdonensis TaxID=302167 RepID=A0A2K9J3Q4_9BACI|nr:hypothetical protein [Virgibacillus dokdonensis]AUJ26579.1 hypothetical protein A21D_03545 [Virgibacillus dokdonensis]